MPYYESVFIARQDISAAQVEELTENFSKVIKDGGGQIPKTESWGLRTMAYKIKKNRKGHYVLMNIDAAADAVHEMERQMRINEDILRTLTTRVDELEEGPSAIMRSRDRDDRPRRDHDDRPRRDHDDRPPRKDTEDEAEKATAEPKADASEAPAEAAAAEPEVKTDEAPAEAAAEPEAETDEAPTEAAAEPDAKTDEAPAEAAAEPEAKTDEAPAEAAAEPEAEAESEDTSEGDDK